MGEEVSVGFPAEFIATSLAGIEFTFKWRVEDEKGNKLKFYASYLNVKKGKRNSNELTDFSEGDTLRIDCVPETWPKTVNIIAYTFDPSDGKSIQAKVIVTEIGRYIALVKKVETAYPTWNGEEVINNLRKLAGYDRDVHQKMLGLKPAVELKPDSKGILGQKDIAELRAMSRHSPDDPKDPTKGTAKDFFGCNVAVGHVLTGISAGQHRDQKVDMGRRLSEGWKKTAAYFVGGMVDNLYAITISGDLGQSVVEVYEGTMKKYIGENWSETEATYSELVGDIDGFLIGENLSKSYSIGSGRSLFKRGEEGIKLSAILQKYYDKENSRVPCSRFRFRQFSRDTIRKELRRQCKEFADTYVYTKGKFKGLIAQLDPHVTQAIADFERWLEIEKKKEEKLSQPPSTSK